MCFLNVYVDICMCISKIIWRNLKLVFFYNMKEIECYKGGFFFLLELKLYYKIDVFLF